MNESELTELRQQGIAALRSSDYPAAAGAFRRLLQARPKDVDLLVLLGVACSQGGDHEGALRALDAAARLNPASANVHYNRGLALERSGAAQEAVQAFQEALRLEPDHAPARQRVSTLAPPAPTPRPPAAPAHPAPDPPAGLAIADPNLALATEVEEAAGGARRSLVVCPRCRAHTRRGTRCERCHQNLPPELGAESLDPNLVSLPPPEPGERIGRLLVTRCLGESVEIRDGGLLGAAAGWVGLLALLGCLALTATALPSLQSGRLIPAVLLLGVAAAGFHYYARVNRRVRVDGRLGRVDVFQLLGLTSFVLRPKPTDTVRFMVDLPDRDNQERCWLALTDPGNRTLLRLGPVSASEPGAGRLLGLTIHLARLLRLKVQVEGYPRNPAAELREALGRLG